MPPEPSDHDLLIEIAVTVKNIDKRIEDHATRLGLLERFRSYCIGVGGVITATIGALKFWGQ